MPTYNFVVVVDDWDMGITHVLRGDDHLNNTPKQVQIYRALGAEPPRFGHMPLILGSDGKRLSKRHGATSVGAYKEMGYVAPALVNYLARLGWACGDMELFSVEELLAVFQVEGIGTSAGKWNPEKLAWVNQQWMMRLPVEDVGRQSLPFFAQKGLHPSLEQATAASATVRARAKTLVEMVDQALFFFLEDGALTYDAKAVEKFLGPAAQVLLVDFCDLLSGIESWSRPEMEARVNAWIAEKAIGLGAVAQPFRVGITGKKVGPGLYEMLEVLGKARSIQRIQHSLQFAKNRGA